MKWIDCGSEMKFFSKDREVKYDTKNKYREFNLYNIRTGTIFCQLKIYDDGSYKIETLEFFNDIKDELYTLMMRDIVTEEPYSYDKWILPLLREKRLNDLLRSRR